MAITDTLTTSSSLLNNVTRYEDVANAVPKQNEAMGQQQFLTLFTAQLQNQNPLDPVKNEAFVAQLAQFSQLEALTGMQSTLNNFVDSMSAEKMLGSAALIGKKVAVENTPINYSGQTDTSAVISLPEGASGIGVQVLNANGQPVRNMVFGPQTPGDFSFSWDGFDDNGMLAANGQYRLVASAVVNQNTQELPVSTVATIRAIVRNASDNSIQVEVDGGTTLALSDVLRIAQ